MDVDERPTKLRKLSHDAAEAGNEASMFDNAFSLQNAANGNAAQDDDAPVKQDGSSSQSLPAPVDVAPSVDDIVDPLVASAAPISKNQLKKLRRQQVWEDKRDERKIVRKEKAVAKRERKREAKQKAAAEGGEEYQAAKARSSRRAVQLPVTFIIDCNFDDLMRDNERKSLGQQLTRSYSDNKNAMFRAHLAISSWGGQLRDRFDGLMEGMHKLWKGVRFMDEGFVDTAEQAKIWMGEPGGGLFKGVFSKYNDLDQAAKEELKQQGEIVYLSSESEDTLTELKPYSTYIIGGLVDKNREKGVCYKRATQAGVKTAKLPIGDYLEMSSRKVLATNHVNEIMLRWLECGDWGDAFMKVIPKRKGGKLRGGSEEHEASAGGEEDGGTNHDVDEHATPAKEAPVPTESATAESADAATNGASHGHAVSVEQTLV